MKSKHHGILLIILVAAALALSGCSGSNTATATPTPTVTPGGSATGTPTPPATAGPTATQGTGTATILSDLYSKTGISWISYRQTVTEAGQTMTTTAKSELLGREMHEGKMMDHVRITSSWGNQDVWTDPDVPADANTTDFIHSNAALARVGPDTVTIDGKAYACTKYTTTITSEDTPVQYTFWASPDAPVPVQYTYEDADGTVMTQLIGWG
jgi:hypothetical protein